MDLSNGNDDAQEFGDPAAGPSWAPNTARAGSSAGEEAIKEFAMHYRKLLPEDNAREFREPSFGASIFRDVSRVCGLIEPESRE